MPATLLVPEPLSLAQPVNWNHPLSVGLVGWWLVLPNINGGVRWGDLVAQYVGTLTNIAAPATATSGWGATSRIGGYGEIRVDGTNDFVTMPEKPSLALATTFSLAVWVKSTIAATSAWREAVHKAGDDYAIFSTIANAGGVPAVAGNIGGGFVSAEGTAVLTTNVWTHLAGTYDGANLRLYVNGAENAVQAATGAITTGGGVLTFGGSVGPSQMLTGALDAIHIYNRALSAVEMSALYIESLRGYPGLLNRRPVMAVAFTSIVGALTLTVTENQILGDTETENLLSFSAVTDALTLTEVVDPHLQAFVAATDAITVSEVVSPKLNAFIAAIEAVSVVETTVAFVPFLAFVVTEPLTLTDPATLVQLAALDLPALGTLALTGVGV